LSSASAGYLRIGAYAVFGDRLVFNGIQNGVPISGEGAAIWISDGTPQGTFKLKTADGGSVNMSGVFVTGGDRIYFGGSIAPSFQPLQLWSSSGNQGDIVQLTGPGKPAPLDGAFAGQGLASLTAAGSLLYFSDRATGRLYVTDATNAVSPVGTSVVSGLGTVLGGSVLFSGSAAGGTGLISVTGTTATFLAPVAITSTSVTLSGGRAFFGGIGDAGGAGLWVTDGSAAGTSRVSSVSLGVSTPSVKAFKDGVAFVANDGVTGSELWFSNGTSSGTFLTADINTRSGFLGAGDASPTNLTVVGDKLYFTAFVGPETNLYSFDGSPGSVRQVVIPGVISSVSQLKTAGGMLYAVGQDGPNSRQLYRLDAAGQATQLSDAVPNEVVRWTFAMGDKLFFYVTALPQLSDNVVFGVAGRLYLVNGPTAGAEFVGAFSGLNTDRAAVVGDRLFFQAGTVEDGAAELWVSDGTVTGTVRVTDTRVTGDANYGPLSDTYGYLLRKAPTGGELDYVEQLAGKVTGGQMTAAAAIADLIDRADATTSVATLSYEFFTGKIPSAAGLDYLVSPTGANAANLNSAYYQAFSMENRYINFAVNLGKLGEGKDAFAAKYGGLSLSEATRTAYTTIFGSDPGAAKVDALLSPSFVLGGQTMTRAQYFALYGQDGPAGIGTKAAMVGWLLSEAAKADVGTYATANEAFLADLADGAVNYAVDIVGVYGGTAYAG